MLTYAETARSNTIVPVESVPDSQQQELPIDPPTSLPSSSSYALGPLDGAQFITLQTRLSTGETCSLLVPLHLPLDLFIDPQFTERYECGYLGGDVEAEWSVPQIVNWTYNTLNEDLSDERAWDELGLHLPAWMVGWVLGNLAWLAETERTLALVGLAHLCFLLPFLTLDAPFWPPCSLRRADFPHREALRAYRQQVRFYREQGRSFVEAQQFALLASVQ